MCKNSIYFRHIYTFCAKKNKKRTEEQILGHKDKFWTEQQKNMIFSNNGLHGLNGFI